MRKAEASAHITRLSPSCPRGGREADGPDPADSFPSLSWGKSASLTSLCCRGCRLHWAQQDSLQDQGREVAGEAEGLGWGGRGALGRPTESTQVAAPCGSPELQQSQQVATTCPRSGFPLSPRRRRPARTLRLSWPTAGTQHLQSPASVFSLGQEQGQRGVPGSSTAGLPARG